jgi:hypothetical protein
MPSALAGSKSCNWQVCSLPLAGAFMGVRVHDSYRSQRHAWWLWIFDRFLLPGRTSHVPRSLSARAFVFRTPARTGSLGG